MANTLEEIIADLEGKKAPEAQMAEKLAEANVENQGDELNELRKLASDLDAQGRAIARGFMAQLAEFQKVAVDTNGMTPNPSAVPDNPAVQVSTGEAHEADTAKVQAILAKLTQGLHGKGPQGAIHVGGNQPVEAVDPIVVDEHPVAADVAKHASEDVISTLYSKYFGE